MSKRKPLRLAVAALSRNVYVGRLSADELSFSDGKVDVTADFLRAVVDKFNGAGEIVITSDKGKRYSITVKEWAPP